MMPPVIVRYAMSVYRVNVGAEEVKVGGSAYSKFSGKWIASSGFKVSTGVKIRLDTVLAIARKA